MKLQVGLVVWLFACSAAGQVAVNETPGIGKNNHTAYIYAPFKWAFKSFDVDGSVVNYVGTGRKDAKDQAVSGQQYTIDAMMERQKPTAENPATTCTVDKFRDLINKHQDDMGVLVISTHGDDNGTLAIEPFGTDDGAEKRRDAAYVKYLKEGYTPAQIVKGLSTEGPDISVTKAFIEKYRQVGQALVYISACFGRATIGSFVGNDEKSARVALGPARCQKVAGTFDYAGRFFMDLDGQPRRERSDTDRLQARAVSPAVSAENAASKRSSESAFVVIMEMAGKGNTTLNAAVRESKELNFPACPPGKVITMTFDTNMDTTVAPKKNDITVTGIEIGDPMWQGGKSNVLEIPITKNDNVTTYSFELPGGSVKSAKNISNMDANTLPAPPEEKAPGINARGPAYSKATPDNYLIKFTNCVRGH